MTQSGYKQFCPLYMAAEVLCTRWTMVLLRELVAGSTRFNDLRRGVPRMSPAAWETTAPLYLRLIPNGGPKRW